ncbi:MAG: hypothetical protein RR304_03975, partial [Bacteroides sp.]
KSFKELFFWVAASSLERLCFVLKAGAKVKLLFELPNVFESFFYFLFSLRLGGRLGGQTLSCERRDSRQPQGAFKQNVKFVRLAFSG